MSENTFFNDRLFPLTFHLTNTDWTGGVQTIQNVDFISKMSIYINNQQVRYLCKLKINILI